MSAAAAYTDRATGPGWELRLGDYREALSDVGRYDVAALISDPPYDIRTHKGQRHGRRDPAYTEPTSGGDGRKRNRPVLLSTTGLEYEGWGDDDVKTFVERWAPLVPGWFVVFSDHRLARSYEDHLERIGHYVFAPIPAIQRGMNVRLAGDGPSNWTTWITPARPRTLRAWGTLPGDYRGIPTDKGENSYDRSKRAVRGAKPLWLMRALIRDYTREGDLVVDPCAGGGTTLLAAVLENRRAIGCELVPDTFEVARKRLEAGYTPTFDFG